VFLFGRVPLRKIPEVADYSGINVNLVAGFIFPKPSFASTVSTKSWRKWV
jgi:hypothetical protein